MYWIAAYDEVTASLDPRDNISVQYSDRLKKWLVMEGKVMVDQFEDQSDALGAARRLSDNREDI